MLRDEISKLRQNYSQSSLSEGTVNSNAIEQFSSWFAEAGRADIYEHNAMTLATCNDNIPDARIVLLKSFTEEGFLFFTNYNSSKGKDLEANPKAALVFLWKELERQVRIRGNVRKADVEISESYFTSRPIDSQCGAIASAQSSIIESREALERKYQDVQEQHKEIKPEMPKHWGGYLLDPTEIEFWQGREGRMHDRLLYTKKSNLWDITRLQP